VPGVFISYRKEDTGSWAITVRDYLASRLGERQVFLDVDSIDAGTWRSQIGRALEQCSVVVVLIGRGWSGSTDTQGRKRLLLEDDVHRRELAAALSRPGVTVIPLLIDGARLPRADELPPDLRKLTECQVMDIGAVREVRVAGLRRLSAAVEHLVGHRSQRRRAIATALASGAVALLNIVIVSESVGVAAAFLIASAVLLTASLVSYRRMVRNHSRGIWIALVAVTLSAALLAGSIARLAFRVAPLTPSCSGI
jgi:hypothetical protein